MARKVDELEKEIAKLPAEELREFRAWYEQFDSAAWDEDLERDIAAGKLDGLADAAISEQKAGKTDEV
jgi:hypothetical protein